ncbi:MAG TPA: beta-ketoacyl-ACP synthase II [Planctomycetota bacterium]|nr:beta-ketoacyl-ACP synthase II [Planctomycetota bacterium]
MSRRRVVVTGLGCVTPAGNDVATTWEQLLAGKSAVQTVDSLRQANCQVTIGAPVRNFDPGLLKVRQDVDRIGRSSQFALWAAVQAWKDAGLGGSGLDPTRMGAVIGTGIGDQAETYQQTQKFVARGPRALHPLYVTKVMLNAAVGLLSVEFGLAGPSFAVASACASGGHAIGTSLRLLQCGDADLILTGGVEESFSCVMNPAAFDAMRALSRRNSEPELASRPFDRGRDGFVLGEGAGMLVLETLEHAQRRGARIHAELVGVGMTSDAHHLVAPDPSGQGAERAMALAVRDAGWKPEDVEYVNAHGTSTPLNDRTETIAIRKVFGPHADRLCVSSQKSMIGHLIGASAAVSLVTTVLSLGHGRIPPTINLTDPDPECDLDYVPHRARSLKFHRALVNSFGFGGHCVTLAVSGYRAVESAAGVN